MSSDELQVNSLGVADIKVTSLHETPSKQRISNHASPHFTHKSIDDFLRDDIEGLTRREVLLDDFLRIVLGFDDEWGLKINNWNLSEEDQYQSLKLSFESVTYEPSSYGPFAKWAEYIIEEVKKKFPEVKASINLKLHTLGQHILPGDFGDRKPDLAGTNENITKEELEWNNALFVFEFKRRQESNKRKSEEADSHTAGKKSKSNSASILKHTKSKGSWHQNNHFSFGTAAKQAKQRSTKASTSKVTSRTGHSILKARSEPAKFTPTLPGFNRISEMHSDNPFMSHNTKISRLGKKGLPKKDSSANDIFRKISASPSSNPEVQLANYALQMLSAEEFRQWTVSVLVDKDVLSLWYYDRSVAFCTKDIKFKEDHESFIKIILALSMCTHDKRKLGFGDLYQSTSDTLSPPSGEANYRYIDAGEFTSVKEDSVAPSNDIPDVGLGPNSKIRFDLSCMLHRQFTLFGRATRVEDIEVGEVEHGKFVSKSSNVGLVLKLSYQVTSRTPEHEIIKSARQIDPVHTPAVLGYCEIDLDLPGKQLEALIGNSSVIKRPMMDIYEERKLVLLIMRKYQNVWDLDGEQFIEVFRQAVTCHWNLYSNRIFHRDLSLQNFKCYKVGEHWKAVLIDYDLSVLLNSEEMRNATSKHRTGTAPFMAIDLLCTPAEGVEVEHLYAHELESWLYIFIHISLGYTDRAPEGHPLKDWWGRNWDKISRNKTLFFNNHIRSGLTFENIDDLVQLKHRTSYNFLFSAMNLIFAAFGELTRKIGVKTLEKKRKLSPKEKWEVNRETWIELLTYETFAEAIGIPKSQVSQSSEIVEGS